MVDASRDELDLIAILRGVLPEHVEEISDLLYDAGIRTIEVPLNSPRPFVSIGKLAARRADWTVGAGTVLSADDVRGAHGAGARLILSPNFDAEVIRTGLQLGLQVMPGIATATEAFGALAAGTRNLKLFPAVTYGPRHLEALRAVLPVDVRVFPVGGIGGADIARWLKAGAAGFGFGSELFRPDYAFTEIELRARELVQALRDARAPLDSSSHEPTQR
jgi:2-dehydro-3-deoxyphosphogalactonate aldolase